MIPLARSCLLVFLLAAICLSSASALQNLRQVDLSPAGPVFSPGTRLNASVVIEILPSGASTFPEGHTIVLGTDLTDARWNVIVTVNGLQAAVIPKMGDVVFLNGFLLSYQDNRDVAVRAVLEGNVPEVPDDQPFTVLRVAELNNQGSSVGGSEQRIIRTVSHLPPHTPAPVTIVDTRVPTTEAGLSACLVLSGITLAILWAVRKKS